MNYHMMLGLQNMKDSASLLPPWKLDTGNSFVNEGRTSRSWLYEVAHE